jgi:hypothetical protein
MGAKLRTLSHEERIALENRECKAEDWERVLVAEDFSVEQLQHVRLEGDIRIGSRSRIIDSTIINYHIGNDCLIDSVLRMECRHATSFGEGVDVAAVNENGGRSATIYRELTAQTAYVMTMMRNRPEAVERLRSLARQRAEEHLSEVGIVEDNVCILGVRFLREVHIESGARIEGAALLENGTIGRNVRVGIDVRAENFIFDDNSRIDGAASIERCFVGENSTIANGFTAIDTLFFANCHCENGEAASVFAGPFTVSHHKSSLLIAGIFSFFNAGSGTNQSNHLFKSGAVHQAVHQRGTKFGSSAYVMAPSIEGAFTVVLGRHTRHHDTQDMPYSYLIESDGETLLMPGLSLKSYGTVRDIQKWKARDKRIVKRDIINFEEFNPFITGKMLRGVDALNRMYETDPEAKEYVYNRTTIRMPMLTRGIKMYNSAIAASLGVMLREGNYRAAEYDGTEWIDVAGQYISLGRVEKILEHITTPECRLEDVDRLFREAAESYDDMAAAYAYNILAEMMCHAPGDEEVQGVVAAADRIIERMREATDADRLRDESFDMMVGYGYDFRDEAERMSDFRATR